ncbi:MAG: hypothetical protein QOG87_1236 [Actinomycetota bacterium]
MSVAPGTTTWSAAALSKSGECYFIKDNATGPGTTFGKTSTAASCTGTDAGTGATGSEW